MQPNKINWFCVTPGCGKQRKTRGLCVTCYQAALKRVNSGETSWEQLEAEGKAEPSGAKAANAVFVNGLKTMHHTRMMRAEHERRQA